MTSTPRTLAFSIENGLFLSEIFSSKIFRASAIARAIAGAIVGLELGLQFLFLGEEYFATSTPRKLAFPIEHCLFLFEIYNSELFRANAIARAIAGAIMGLELGLHFLLFFLRGGYFVTSTPRKLAFPIENGLFLSEIYSSKVFRASAIARAIAGAIMELELGLQLLF